MVATPQGTATIIVQEIARVLPGGAIFHGGVVAGFRSPEGYSVVRLFRDAHGKYGWTAPWPCL